MDESLRVALRVIFLVPHIIFAGMAISQFPVGMILRRMIRAATGKPNEMGLMGTYGQIIGALGQIGGIGLLITGLGLIGTERLGFLGIGGAYTPLWLMIKQIIYIIILVIIIAVITPGGRRTAGVMMAAAKAGQPVNDEMRAMFARNVQIGYIINVLVFVNIILAVWRPTGM